MIQIFLEEDLVPFESDIRELLKAFYPGEDFQLHTPDGVRLMETTQEEKNALKRGGDFRPFSFPFVSGFKRTDASPHGRTCER